MSKMIALIKVFLKTTGDESFEGKKKSSSIAFMIVMVALMIFSLGVPLAAMTSEFYDNLVPLQQQGLVIGLLMAIASVMIFIFGIAYSMATFYFAKDIEYLLPLPLKPYEILGAKFTTVVIYEYMTEIIILLLPLIIYGIKDNASIGYWIIMILTLLLLPVFPLVIASIIDMVVMSFTNIGKHKDALRTLGAILAIGLGFGVSFLSNKMGNVTSSPEKMVDMIMEGNNSLVSVVSSIFPTSKFAAESLVGHKTLMNFGLFLLLTAAALVIFLVIANKIYFKGALGASETFSKRKKLTEEEFSKSTKVQGVTKAFILKEVKALFRTPVYFLNCVLMNFLWPIFFMIPLAMQPELFKTIGENTAHIFTEGTNGFILAIVVSAMIFMGNSNMIASTAISREGKNLFFSKYIPIPYHTQLLAKAYTGMAFSAINLIFILVVGILAKAPVTLIILALILSVVTIAASNFLGLILDLMRPKLNWDNETTAVKQNFNAMISMFGGMAIAAVNGILFYNLKTSMMTTFLIELVILVVVNVVAVKYLKTKGAKLYERLS